MTSIRRSAAATTGRDSRERPTCILARNFGTKKTGDAVYRRS